MTRRPSLTATVTGIVGEYGRFAAFGVPALVLAWLFGLAHGGVGPEAAFQRVITDGYLPLVLIGFVVLPTVKVVAGPPRRRLSIVDGRFVAGWLVVGVIAASLLFFARIALDPAMGAQLLADAKALALLPVRIFTGVVTVLTIILPESLAIVVGFLAGVAALVVGAGVVLMALRLFVFPFLHGTVLGVVPAVLFTVAGHGSLGANLGIWGLYGGIVFTRLLVLDPSKVDDWAVYGAVGGGLLATLVLAPTPSLVVLFAALGAGVGSGLDVGRGTWVRRHHGRRARGRSGAAATGESDYPW